MNLRNPLEKGEKGPLGSFACFARRKGGELHENGFQFVSRSAAARQVLRERGRVPAGAKKSGLGNWTVFSRAAMLRNGAALSAWNEKFPQRNLKRKAVPSRLALELERGNIHRKQKKGTLLTNFMEGPLAGNLPLPQNRKEGAISGGGRRSAVCAWGINCNSDPPTLQGVQGSSWRGQRDAKYRMLELKKSLSFDPPFPP